MRFSFIKSSTQYFTLQRPPHWGPKACEEHNKSLTTSYQHLLLLKLKTQPPHKPIKPIINARIALGNQIPLNKPLMEFDYNKMKENPFLGLRISSNKMEPRLWFDYTKTKEIPSYGLDSFKPPLGYIYIKPKDYTILGTNKKGSTDTQPPNHVIQTRG